MADENQTILQVRKRTNERTVAEMFEYICFSLVVCSSVHRPSPIRKGHQKRKETWNGLLILWGSSRRGHHARLVLSIDNVYVSYL